jgi:hypothetical protein
MSRLKCNECAQNTRRNESQLIVRKELHSRSLQLIYDMKVLHKLLVMFILCTGFCYLTH